VIGIDWKNWEPRFVSIDKGETKRLTIGEPKEVLAKYDEKEKLVVEWRVFTVDGEPCGEKYWRTASRHLLYEELRPLWTRHPESPNKILQVAVKRDLKGKYVVVEV